MLYLRFEFQSFHRSLNIQNYLGPVKETVLFGKLFRGVYVYMNHKLLSAFVVKNKCNILHKNKNGQEKKSTIDLALGDIYIYYFCMTNITICAENIFYAQQKLSKKFKI